MLQQANARLAQERDAVKTALVSEHQAKKALCDSLEQSASGSRKKGSGSEITTTTGP